MIRYDEALLGAAADAEHSNYCCEHGETCPLGDSDRALDALNGRVFLDKTVPYVLNCAYRAIEEHRDKLAEAGDAPEDAIWKAVAAVLLDLEV